MKTRILSLFAIAAMAMCTSCTKEDISQEEQLQSGPFEVTISAEMSEFAPTTKSTAESCIRMKWSAGDIVWAYDKDGNKLNGLTVSLPDGAYVAALTGTLSSIPSDGYLYLVHSSLLSTTSQPEYSDLASISMAAQSADVTPFVAYAVVEGVTADPSNLKTKFSFATSVLKINATGIVTGETLTSATLSDINTTCRLTIDATNKTFVITQNSTSGTITKTLTGTVSSTGRASFYVGVPRFADKTTDRILTVNTETSGSVAKAYFDYAVVAEGKAENKYINYVYEVKTLDYTDEYGESRGNGTYIVSTGVVWAPVNCGYEPTNYPYGKLYQWGRKYGCGYTGSSTTSDNDAGGMIQTLSNNQTSLEAEDAAKFYYNHTDWCSNHYYNLWDSSISASCTTSGHIPTKTDRDPCPNGWRVPTYDELNKLIGSHKVGNMQTGTHGSTTNLNGKWFDGSSTSAPTSGVFLPADGRRDGSSGNVDYRGSYGYYWCSSAYDDRDARLLFFYLGYAYMSMYDRACGYSVRCVQE